MVAIQLYQPQVINCTISIPTTWADLHIPEIIQLSKCLSAQANLQQEEKASLLLFIIQYRADVQHVHLPKNWQLAINIDDFAINAIDLLQAFFKESQLTINPFPTLQIPSLGLMYGPDNEFKNITCGEFEACEIHLKKFVESSEKIHIANIMAILWRPQNQSFFSIVNYKEVVYKYESVAIYFSLLPAYQLCAAFLWYYGCRSFLPKLFPTVYNHNSEDGDDAINDNMQFTRCIHAGAGAKNGSRQQIRIMKLLEFMFDMEQEAIQSEKIKAQYE